MRTFILDGNAVFNSLNALNQLSTKELSYSLALHVAQLANALRPIAVTIQRLRDEIRTRYTARYSEDHPLAGRPLPVYLDATPTAQRVPENTAAIVAGALVFTDDAAVTRELEALGAVKSEVQCIVLTSRELRDVVIRPALLEPLLWNIDADGEEEAPDSKDGRGRRLVRA